RNLCNSHSRRTSFCLAPRAIWSHRCTSVGARRCEGLRRRQGIYLEMIRAKLCTSHPRDAESDLKSTSMRECLGTTLTRQLRNDLSPGFPVHQIARNYVTRYRLGHRSIGNLYAGVQTLQIDVFLSA